MILEDDVNLAEEHGSGMGPFNITSETEPSDEAIQNEAYKYYEVDKGVFNEKPGTQSQGDMCHPHPATTPPAEDSLPTRLRRPEISPFTFSTPFK